MTEPLQQLGRTYVRFRGRKLSYFSGCDYYRLASHPQVFKAVRDGMRRYGLNVAASRLTTGNHGLYEELETQLAEFFGAESALLVSNGYLTNTAVTQALAGQFTHALIDERGHPSLQNAARFLECPIRKFKHRDTIGLKRAVQNLGGSAKLLVLTDGMFSHDGSSPPLRDYLAALPKSAMLLVDDAHAAGVLGRTGKGSLEHHGVDRKRLIQTITLSKAFGVFGGAVLADRGLCERMVERSGVVMGSTPLPLPLAAAAIKSIALVAQDSSLRRRLFENAAYVKQALLRLGLDLEDTPGPIIQITAVKSELAKRTLLKRRIYPPFVRYPGGPAKGYFRFAISSEHTRAQLNGLIAAVIEL